MNILEWQEKRQDFDDKVYDIIQILEEQRFCPSIREAGSAPTDNAVNQVTKMITECVIEFKDIDFNKVWTFEDIIKEIESSQDKNIADKIDSLKEIDTLPTTVDGKYKELTTIYLHKPSNRHLIVYEQRYNNDFNDTVCVSCKETKKKEIVKYEWE